MRVFFALELAPVDKLSIDNWRDRNYAVLGAGVAAENLHLTLAFAGECAVPRLEDLCDGAAAIEARQFSLRMDELGYWPRQQLFWLGCSDVPPALQQLAGHCRRLVAAMQLRKSRKPYVPHITLWRGLEQPPPAAVLAPDFTLSFDAFALFESNRSRRGAVQYQVLERWPLSPPIERSSRQCDKKPSA